MGTEAALDDVGKFEMRTLTSWWNHNVDGSLFGVIV